MWVVQTREGGLGRAWVTVAYGLTPNEALLLQNKLVLKGIKVRTFKQDEDEIVV